MREKLITLEPVEGALTPEVVDERLGAGWFPWCGRWMTCHAWPGDEGPRNTIWVRVKLAVGLPSDRMRRLLREGCSVNYCEETGSDEEHRALYDQFRASRHPEWDEDGAEVIRSYLESPFRPRTRELAVRDPGGRLIAFRWFLVGGEAIAGLTCVFDTARSGLGTIARTLVEEWAARAGHTWNYPGYVMPGADDPWYYKIKRGRSEWLDPDTSRWRTWDGDEPRAEQLALAVMRRKLSAIGEVMDNPGWPVPCFDPTSRGVANPMFVVGPADEDGTLLVVWNHARKRYEQLKVTLPASAADGDAPDED